jgi:hypothetical protein
MLLEFSKEPSKKPSKKLSKKSRQPSLYKLLQPWIYEKYKDTFPLGQVLFRYLLDY